MLTVGSSSLAAATTADAFIWSQDVATSSFLLNAILFFAFWLAVLYAGADHPPPPGFVWLVLLTLVAACLVYWRVGTYLTWIERGQLRYLLRVMGEGFVVGLAFALVASAASSLLGYGEPTVQPRRRVTLYGCVWSVSSAQPLPRRST